MTLRQCGKFQGVSTATTPSGTWRNNVVPALMPATSWSTSWVASWAACMDMNPAPSICMMRSLPMQPHSVWDSAKKSSACLVSASPSWFRHRARCSADIRPHGPLSKARRAAAIASSTCATLASGAVAMTASVDGDRSS